ncbi:MAG TPA: hypothetical protein VLS90_02730, partial [Thermodesulfobacteriota bacterium]|nr:hypothetical protein [Thermodesulfobacteriota bacterium]
MKTRKRIMLQIGVALGLVLLVAVPQGGAQSFQTMDISTPVLNDKLASGGFLTSKPIPVVGNIVGSAEPQENLTQGDTIYLKIKPGTQVKPGDTFLLARFGREVLHPVTKEKMGAVVRFSGLAIILDGRGETIPAFIKRSFIQISYNDVLVPMVSFPTSLSLRVSHRQEGMIVASPEGEENISQNEVVYIDRGMRDGLIKGDVFTIYQWPYYEK